VISAVNVYCSFANALELGQLPLNSKKIVNYVISPLNER
jgi:hypothetical protein